MGERPYLAAQAGLPVPPRGDIAPRHTSQLSAWAPKAPATLCLTAVFPVPTRASVPYAPGKWQKGERKGERDERGKEGGGFFVAPVGTIYSSDSHRSCPCGWLSHLFFG